VGNLLEEAPANTAAIGEIRIRPAGIHSSAVLLTGIALPPTQRGK
jgi:hypothetical protein